LSNIANFNIIIAERQIGPSSISDCYIIVSTIMKWKCLGTNDSVVLNDIIAVT